MMGNRMPFDRQANERMCGAAALCMAYRSLGVEVSQGEVWPRLVGKNPLGDDCSYTHRLGEDAMRRGLAALVLEAEKPWEILQRCQALGYRVVLNHRSTQKAWTGHYTVLLDLQPELAIVHDPQIGPARRIPRNELLDLWQRTSHPLCEISGNNLVVLARAERLLHHCTECGEPTPESLRCDRCGQETPLHPGPALGCMSATCSARLWRRIFCPHCDHVVGSTLPIVDLQAAGCGEGGSPLSDALGDLSVLLNEAQQVLPAGEDREQITRLITEIESKKDALIPALKEQIEASKAQLARLQVMVRDAKAAESSPPLPASDPEVAREIEAIDPQLGFKLRRKLFEELRQFQVVTPVNEDPDLEAWQGWGTPDEREHAQARRHAEVLSNATPRGARRPPSKRSSGTESHDPWEDLLENTRW